MSQVNIDTDVLAQLAQTLANAAMALNSAISAPSEPEKPRKRGRPKKDPKLANNNPRRDDFVEPSKNEVVEVEPEILEIVNDNTPPPQPRQREIFLPKAFNNVGGVGVASASEEVTKNRGQMKFLDIKNIPSDNVQYPEPTDRRPPAKKMIFQCSRCNQSFEAYPSEVPQAFFKNRLPGSPVDDTARVYCENCVGK